MIIYILKARYLETDQIKKRSKKAFQIANQKLNILEKNSKEKNSNKIYNIILEFLSDKTNLNFKTKTNPEIKENLKSFKLSEALIKELLAILDEITIFKLCAK